MSSAINTNSVSTPALTTTIQSTMKRLRISQLPLSTRPSSARLLHTSSPKPATVQPITASGPPPKVPVPSAEHVDSRVARRRKQAELLKRGQDLRAVAAGTGGGSAKTKRFWRDVHVRHADGTFSPFLSHLPTIFISCCCFD
jgi:hypothetical protein